jgi:hypothetical protein
MQCNGWRSTGRASAFGLNYRPRFRTAPGEALHPDSGTICYCRIYGYLTVPVDVLGRSAYSLVDRVGKVMPQFLIGIMFHESEPFALWNRGLVEDYESSAGLFIDANSAAEAIAWGEQVGQALLHYVNHDESLDWRGIGYFCWVEESPRTSCWSHCLDFFSRVSAGEMPNLEQMGTAAYCRWQKQQASRAALCT